MFKYLNNIIFIYIYITDRSQMVRHFLWVKDLVSSILTYLIFIINILIYNIFIYIFIYIYPLYNLYIILLYLIY